MTTFESELDKALRSLKNQGIVVTTAFVAEDGMVYQVDGYLLTEQQILKLQEGRNLHLQGIKEFDTVERDLVEKDIDAARRRIRTDQMKSWTAKEICEYINQEFNRNHSVGQVRGVLNRLGVEYKKA